MHPVLSVRGLSKTYRGGTTALAGLDLEVRPGMYGLLGPNGAGKTTLMRILATLLQPTSGEARLGDIDIAARPAEARRFLGYLPQEFGTYPSLTVYEYLDYLGLLSGLNRRLRRERIDRLLAEVNLEDCRTKPTRGLSGGMKRRLGIAQALLGDPALLIVDEPTAGLDPEERVRFRNLLSEMAGDRLVLLSTHIVEDVGHTCGRMAVLRAGHLVFEGSPSELIRRSQGRVWGVEADEATAAALRSRNQITSLVRTACGVALRLVAAERPTEAAAPVEPSLEDAYLDLMGETDAAGRENA